MARSKLAERHLLGNPSATLMTMCGIGAILRSDGGVIPETWLDVIDRRLEYRGPDGSGRWRDGRPGGASVALVHRRLSVIDHTGGGQPMVTDEAAGDPVAVVFNGCIYNHRDLRRELTARGHVFTSDHSDTEVLLRGFGAWGDGLTDRVDGMYAWIIWDGATRTLHAARDWFGEKPLFEGSVTSDGVTVTVLASDASAVAQVLELARAELGVAGDGGAHRCAWLARYLRFGYDLDETPYAGVRHVPIGLPPRLVEAQDEPPGDMSPSGIEAMLEAAVASQLEADVPLGCFLSGGVDSSLVAYFAQRHDPALRTFSVRMPDPRYDESQHAAHVARHLGTAHTTLEIAPEPAADLVHLVRTMGRPFGDSSLLPTHWVSRAARAHVTVALSGDGGDELFYGYERYAAARLLAAASGLLRLLPASLGAGAHPKSRIHKLGRLAGMAKAFNEYGVLATELLFAPAVIEQLLTHDLEAPKPERVTASGDAARALRNADLRRYLPGDLLAKVDSAAMAVALEVRCPLLDRNLARAIIPADRTALTQGGRKGLLRTIARRHLPAEIVDRPKMGFAIPIGEWFRSDFGGMKTLLVDQLSASEPFGALPIAQQPVDRMLREHLDGRRDHGQRLFALLSLALWARE